MTSPSHTTLSAFFKFGFPVPNNVGQPPSLFYTLLWSIANSWRCRVGRLQLFHLSCHSYEQVSPLLSDSTISALNKFP